MSKRKPAPKGFVHPEEARDLIVHGKAPDDLRVVGDLVLSGLKTPFNLPDRLSVSSLTLDACRGLSSLPKAMHVRRLTLTGAWDPGYLLDGLHIYELELRESQIRSLPPSLRVEYRLDLENCTGLVQLPENLKAGCIILSGCTSLEALPEGLETYFLDISGCTGITQWPARGSVSVGRFTARGCAQLKSIPPWLGRLAQLDLRDCTNITALPDGLEVSSWIDVAGTGLTSLPRSMDGVQLRWRGVEVDARIAFLPETITAEQIIAEVNVEKRRVMLERMGYEQFLAKANAETLDQDRDPGGPRRLIRVRMPDDEDLVCVSVFCPSTGRQYVLRVPPTTQTCHHAAAWIAGFDNPDDYHPVIET